MRHSKQAVTLKDQRKAAIRADAVMEVVKTKTPAELNTYINSKVADLDLRKILKVLLLLALEDK